MTSKIKKAIFPVAGFGTRFLPATKACPKEMLVVVDKPLIQYAVEEAYAAGIRQMIFITGRNKRAIEDHFDTAYELEMELELKNKKDLLDVVQKVKPDDMECVYIRQPKALGLGHAVYCARHIVNQDPFAVLLADDLMVSQTPVLKQLIDLYEHYQSSVIAIQNIEPEETNRYGIIQGNFITPQTIDMTLIVEKPKPEEAPSTLAVSGRYIFNASIFNEIDLHVQGNNNEIQLTDAIFSLLKKEKILGYLYEGHRFDCGSKVGFLRANLEIGKPFLENERHHLLLEAQSAL